MQLRFLKLIIFSFIFLDPAAAQEKDSTKNGQLNFSGTVSLTTNGFSPIPALSLGKPALMTTFNLNNGRRWSFEPEFRYSLEFKPWSFIFIWRYKAIQKEKFYLSLGTHLPTINFVTRTATINGVEQEIIKARRFFPVVEVNPMVVLSKKVQVGVFYQFSHGLEPDVPKFLDFVALRANFTDVGLGRDFFLNFNPQLYFLALDRNHGYYVTYTLVAGKHGFPFRFSTALNKAITTNIPGHEFDWNVSAVYAFSSRYHKRA